MTLEIRKIHFNSSKEIDDAFPIIKELRPHLSLQKFREFINKMADENYELWGAYDGSQLLGLVSSRLYTDLVRGPHLYIDDLVTSEKTRSKGIGAKLLKHVEELAKQQGLEVLRLSCVLENENALKFYRREGWKERAFALVKKVPL